MRVDLDGRQIEVSNADRVVFPRDGVTKGDVVAYVRDVSGAMLLHAGRRPLALHRFPKGIDGGGFYQKNTPKFYPSWIPRVRLPKEGGSTDTSFADSRAALVYFANQNVLTLHAWVCRADDVWHPDMVIVDFDPPDAGSFEVVREAAFAARRALEDDGLSAFVKTSGSKGLHVVAPLEVGGTYEDVSAYAERVAGRLVDADPSRLTLEFSKADRDGRVYVDVGRNTWAQHAAVAYTPRALDGAPVSMPVTWDELTDPSLGPAAFSLRRALETLDERGDAWADMWAHARPLPR